MHRWWLDRVRSSALDLQKNLDPGESLGKAPQGIVIDGAGTRAFVYNFISRTVSAIDISIPTAPTVVATRNVSEIPVNATVQLGAALFYTGRGPQGRMSSESWGGCIVCHPNGRSDNVTWMFDAGPRQTIPLDGMFNKNNRTTSAFSTGARCATRTRTSS